jgi:hypothetical protein
MKKFGLLFFITNGKSVLIIEFRISKLIFIFYNKYRFLGLGLIQVFNFVLQRSLLPDNFEKFNVTTFESDNRMNVSECIDSKWVK